MSRIVIDEPEKYIFSTNIPVRVGDINRTGHVSWNGMFSILDEAYVQFWDKINRSMPEDERISRITVEAGINYKKQAFHGQILRVEIGVDSYSSKGFELVFKVTETAGGDEVARAKQTILCYDYEKQKVTQVPEGLRKRLDG